MRERGLKVTLVIVGLLFTALIYPLAMILWGRSRDEYGDGMMLSIYVVMGIFLLLASREPSANRSLVLFAGWANIAHAATMAVMAVTDVADRMHLLVGIIAFAILGLLLLVFTPACSTANSPSRAISAG